MIEEKEFFKLYDKFVQRQMERGGKRGGKGKREGRKFPPSEHFWNFKDTALEGLGPKEFEAAWRSFESDVPAEHVMDTFY
jgi:hypothetical protein